MRCWGMQKDRERGTGKAGAGEHGIGTSLRIATQNSLLSRPPDRSASSTCAPPVHRLSPSQRRGAACGVRGRVRPKGAQSAMAGKAGETGGKKGGGRGGKKGGKKAVKGGEKSGEGCRGGWPMAFLGSEKR